MATPKVMSKKRLQACEDRCPERVLNHIKALQLVVDAAVKVANDDDHYCTSTERGELTEEEMGNCPECGNESYLQEVVKTYQEELSDAD